MRIDWTQTLIGSSASLQELSGHAESPARREHITADVATVEAGRLAGVLASSALIGLAIMLLPMRGAAVTLTDILGLSGMLVANVAGFLVLGRVRRMGLAAASGFFALPFAIAAGMAGPVLVALAILLLLDAALMATPAGMRRAPMLSILAVASFVAIAAVLFASPGPGGAMLIAAALVPTAVFTALHLRKPAVEIVTNAESEVARLTALLEVSTRGGARQTFVTDSVGVIDRSGVDVNGAGEFRQHLASESFPEGSVVAATLIADRVVLLKALSRAIHDAGSTVDFEIRLRLEPVGAGYPVPPRYDAFMCSVHPMPGVKGLAIIAIEAVARDDAERPAAAPSIVNAPDSAMLARALHDCNSPFNAGMGFLEMIADPQLAPRDITTYREFAAEAHKAISEAHRNSVLLGHWLRHAGRTPDEAGPVAEIAPGRLVADAVRVLNLRDSVERGEIRLIETVGLPVVRLPLAAARFATEVLLRFAQGQMGSEIRVMQAGRDLVLSCHVDAHEHDTVLTDAFQHALEAVAQSLGPIRFVSNEAGEHTLRFTEAFTEDAIRTESVGVDVRGISLVRLAS